MLGFGLVGDFSHGGGGGLLHAVIGAEEGECKKVMFEGEKKVVYMDFAFQPWY